MRRTQVRFGSTIVATALAAMLALTACGGGGSSADGGGNAMAGLEQESGDQPNENLTIGDDMTIPADWPKDVPVFASGSLTTVGVNPDGSADASWITPTAAADVAAEYDAALTAAGFSVVAGSELTGIEDMSGADYSKAGYGVNVLVSTTDGETTLFVTVTPA